VTELSVSVTVHDTEAGPCIVVALVGEADVTTKEMAEVFAAEAARRPRLLVVDLSALSFMDSASLGVIVRAHRVLRQNGGSVALVRPTPVAARVLELAGIVGYIPVYQTVAEALLPRGRPGVALRANEASPGDAVVGPQPAHGGARVAGVPCPAALDAALYRPPGAYPVAGRQTPTDPVAVRIGVPAAGAGLPRAECATPFT
jgi:anti-anti-sigma factor